jgi:hypothetical protein
VEFTGVEKRNLASIAPVMQKALDSAAAVTARTTVFSSLETRVCEEIPSDFGVGAGGKLKSFRRVKERSSTRREASRNSTRMRSLVAERTPHVVRTRVNAGSWTGADTGPLWGPGRRRHA